MQALPQLEELLRAAFEARTSRHPSGIALASYFARTATRGRKRSELDLSLLFPKAWKLPALYALPETSQITRHICVEGWSAIGSWQGVRLSDFLKRIGADTRAKYVWFQCAEGYSNTIDMATALHPQTQLSLKFDNQILPRKYGFPMKCRMPTKLGFKNPKYVIAMHVTNQDLGGYWEDKGYNWFSGL